MKRILFLCLMVTICCCITYSQNIENIEGLGKNSNIEITTGQQGAFSFYQFGFNFPQFIDNFIIGVKFRGMSSLTWATFIDEKTKDSVSFHPITLAGVLSMGGTGNITSYAFRNYGAFEILAGYSFTPYDSIIYGVGNLIGNNITLGIFGIYGIEYFTTPTSSIFIESGGGFKTIKAVDKNQYVIAGSWLGSGVTFRMGTKIYFK